MNKHKNYLEYVIKRLKERAIESKEDCKKHDGKKDFAFYEGRNLAFYEILSMLQNDTVGFHIDTKEIKLDFDPEVFLAQIKKSKFEKVPK